MMKRLLVPIFALLVFSMLCTSVSAPNGYYTVRFCGSATGCCWVFEEALGPEQEPMASERGRFHISGFAIAAGGPDFFGAQPEYDPNTLVHTGRASLRVTWDTKILMVYLWPSRYVAGMFADPLDTFMLMNVSFVGYYMGDFGLQYVSGNNASIMHGLLGPAGEAVLASVVMLYMGGEHFLTFAWVAEEIPVLPPGCVAKSITRRVIVWPRGWPA